MDAVSCDGREAAVWPLRACAARTPAPDLSAWHALQRCLEDGEHRVAIPFARPLVNLIPPIAVRLRRDVTTVLNLIAAHALLHQETRARDEENRVVATSQDYGIVRELVVDLVSEGVGATVPQTIRETVAAVKAETLEEGMSTTYATVAKRLHLDKSAAKRRVDAARARGFIKNLEEKRGRPARLVIGEPLPDDVVILPSAERVAGGEPDDYPRAAESFESEPPLAVSPIGNGQCPHLVGSTPPLAWRCMGEQGWRCGFCQPCPGGAETEQWIDVAQAAS